MEHLETARLLLRPFVESDYPLILKISSDPDTVKYLFFLPWVHPVSSKRYPSRFESRVGFFASTRDECLSPRVRLTAG